MVSEDFKEKLSQIHLNLYHLMLDIETSYEESCVCNKIIDSFDEAWKTLYPTQEENKDGDA